MTTKWEELVATNKQAASAFQATNPKMLDAFRSLNAAQPGPGKLDAKTRELISLAVAVTTRCEGCIGSHAAAAVKAGATPEEVSEALGVAIALNAGAAYVYSLKVLDAVAEFSGEKT